VGTNNHRGNRRMVAKVPRLTGPDHFPVIYLATVDCATETKRAARLNAWCTPKHILDAHPPDQRPQFPTNQRPASGIPRLPAPVPTKARTMPAHQCLGPNDRDGLEDRGKQSIQQDEEQAIGVRQLGPTPDRSLQHDQLMPECSVLCFKPTCRLDRRGQQPEKEA
jgi:hypothetical protein